MAEPTPLRYRAFLSYSHRDTAWGKWLHGALEGYRIDKDLVGRETPAGPVPKALRPIFRDREDFSAGHSLTDQTSAALENSQFLVVVCSPNAARSQYVNEEIQRYKALGRSNRVIPIIVDGEPGDPERECFPPALRFKVGDDGALTEEREEPIAADVRPQGDGKDLAKLKLVAGLLGVGLDEIVRRAERARRQRLRNWVGALGLLTVTFAGLAIWAEINRREADLQRQHAVASLDAATKTSNSLIYDLALRFRHELGVPSALIKDILSRAQKLQTELTASGQTSIDLQHAQASALSESALTSLSIGDRAGAFETAEHARQILEDLLAKNPNDSTLQLDLGVVYQRLGDTLAGSGQTDQALAAYEKARALHAARVAVDETDDKAQRNLATDHNLIGDALASAGKLDEALASYRNNLKIMQMLVRRDKRRADWLRDLGIAYERIGMVLAQQKKFDQALVALQQRLTIAQALVEDSDSNTQYQRDLSVANNKIGDVLMATGKTDEAISAYEKGLAIRQKLVSSDAANAVWRRDLAISNNLIGTALSRRGKLDEALAAFRAGLVIEQQLVAQDQHNTGWQSDLYASHIIIGRLLAQQGTLDVALKSFQDGLVIAVAQSKAHPESAIWKSHLKYGITQLGALSYRFVLAREFAPGLKTADDAISLAPEMIWLYGNRAHALMFLDRAEEAQALYLQYRGRKDVQDKTSWEDAIRSDFAAFRKAGLVSPLMDEVEKQFAPG